MPSPPGPTCEYCGHSIADGEKVCPWCGRLLDQDRAPRIAAPRSEHVPVASPRYTIALDALEPIEAVAWEAREQKLTLPQFLKLLASRQLNIESHPLLRMVMDCPERGRHITCDHTSHDTEAKKDKCVRGQAAKLATRTLRHHIGFLHRLDMWSEPRSLMRHAMWSCVERHGQACALCRAREGTVVPVEDKRVPILHPGCNCTLVQLAGGQRGRKTILRTLRYVEARDPERARVMRENLARSGFGHELGAGCCGCIVPLIVLAVLVPAAILWIVR